MALSVNVRNRIGYILLGLTNNFAYAIMLSAAYDLLKQTEIHNVELATGGAANSTLVNVVEQKYCNEQSTSSILLADTIPSLATKLIYPFFLVDIPVAYKASVTAALTTASFLFTGLFTDQILIFTGVACASFSSGLGESTYLSNSPLYGDVALSGWSMGTGGAGLLGAGSYALLKMVLSIRMIMIIMLIVPILMMIAYFKVIQVVDSAYSRDLAGVARTTNLALGVSGDEPAANTLCVISRQRSEDELSRPIELDLTRAKSYGANKRNLTSDSLGGSGQLIRDEKFDMKQKIRFLPSLAKYFLPLVLVYFAEYFINQGLFELIYFPYITFLDHAAQYRWYLVTYQLGVFISRSTLDLFQIHQLWTMSILQALNALLFLAHTAKLIHIPSFYLVIGLIVYEGLLGGFTYANTFYRMKRELSPEKHEFGVSTVTIADTLGIVIAGAVAMPVHNALCKLYE